jgi:glutaredoxin
MSINSIEVICPPCPKCERLKGLIKQVIGQMETQFKTKIIYNFKHTVDLREVSQLSVNASKTPIVVINGQVELAGGIEMGVLKSKLLAFHAQ